MFGKSLTITYLSISKSKLILNTCLKRSIPPYAYAWFIYITESRFDLSAKIVSWDVNFLNGSQEVSEVYDK